MLLAIPHPNPFRFAHRRHTTGIWIWSEPFVRTGANGEKLAVYVVDTQGLFDNETTQSLTACIFGLSTLLSSHSIYNVSGRIGEDALQHLALFSEYGRVAMEAEAEEEEEGGEERKRKGKKTPFQRIEVRAEGLSGGLERSDGERIIPPSYTGNVRTERSDSNNRLGYRRTLFSARFDPRIHRLPA